MTTRATLTIALIASALMIVCGHAAAQSSAASAQLGSPNYKPSLDNPVGWRGDWTGRFPAATPPLEWARRVTGATTEMKYQADKPAGDSATGAKALEYFTIKDWLVVGPFSVDDPVAGMDKDFLGGEDKASPAKDAKVGDVAWKYLRADIDTQSLHAHNEGTCGNTNVDFVYAFGKFTVDKSVQVEGDLNNKVAYAHTYIYSPAETKARLHLPFRGTACRFWLNGKPTNVDPKLWDKVFDVSLNKGWNRLLVKVSTDKATAPEGQNAWVSRWMCAAYITPSGKISYDTKNVAWMTRMTGRSMSQPIIVGDRIYIGSGTSDLMCIDKKTGKVLWLQSNTPYDAAEDKGAFKEIEPLAGKLAALNKEVVDALNAAVSPSGMSSDQQAVMDGKLKAKGDAERAIHDAFNKIDSKKYPQMYINEVSASNATPVSDGKFVYWACGGGMKGPGAYVIACFDLDGKRIWSHHDTLGAVEHGTHISPNLINGKLIYGAVKTVYAYDPATGKELWKAAVEKDWQQYVSGNSPLAVKIGGTPAIVASRYVFSAADGSTICPTGLDIWGDLTPICENGVIINPFKFPGHNNGQASFIANKLPAAAGANAKVTTVVDLPGKDANIQARMFGATYTVASPLYVDGVVYSIESGGGLSVVDLNERKALYRMYLDGYNRYNRYVYGVCASPTMAGKDKNIYITDDAGYTHVIKPGAEFKPLARNILENIHLSGLGGNPCKQESFYTAPWFEGTSMYLRGEEYLYCITGK